MRQALRSFVLREFGDRNLEARLQASIEPSRRRHHRLVAVVLLVLQCAPASLNAQGLNIERLRLRLESQGLVFPSERAPGDVFQNRQERRDRMKLPTLSEPSSRAWQTGPSAPGGVSTASQWVPMLIVLVPLTVLVVLMKAGS
jgi:hypothetical protein